MPLIKSAIKRARQNDKRRARRLPFKTHMKTMMRKVVDLTKEGKSKEAEAILPNVYKSIDTAAKKNIIHKNNAARKKAHMARLVAGASK
jgi:small subunit ribosomal protein S20|tara:strand:- start:115 stop:381 length:267 start_codon:yes stop_codon:yes gene_type:complete